MRYWDTTKDRDFDIALDELIAQERAQRGRRDCAP